MNRSALLPQNPVTWEVTSLTLPPHQKWVQGQGQVKMLHRFRMYECICVCLWACVCVWFARHRTQSSHIEHRALCMLNLCSSTKFCHFQVAFFLRQNLLGCYQPLAVFQSSDKVVFCHFLLIYSVCLWGNRSLELPILQFCWHHLIHFLSL